MEPSGAMPEDAQARKCVGEELVDLQDGRSGVTRSNRDPSENFRVHVKRFSAPAPLSSFPRLRAALEGVLVLVAVPVDPSLLSPIDNPRLNLRSAFPLTQL